MTDTDKRLTTSQQLVAHTQFASTDLDYLDIPGPTKKEIITLWFHKLKRRIKWQIRN